MARVIGLDLGTVFSVVARISARGRPRVVPNRDGRRKTRSVVLFEPAGPLVGHTSNPMPAGNAAPAVNAAPAGAAASLARFAGCSLGDPTWRYEAPDGRLFRSEEISALILRRLKEDAELALGAEVTDAVLTVPACFNAASRRATADAGRIAGLTVHRVLNAPTAAALAYGRAISAGSTVLVYGLGGGNFDASVLHAGDREFEVLATRGDRTLGGLDWDNELMKLLNHKFRKAGGPDLLDQRDTELELRDKAELAKHCLTTLAQIQVVLSANGIARTVTVRRTEFEAVTARLLNRTRDLAQAAVEAAGLNWGQIDQVLPAGGPTRMPMVRSMLKRVVGLFTPRLINPEEVVALGAVMQAQSGAEPGRSVTMPAGGAPRTVREVTSYGLGALARDSGTGRRRNVVVIPANTPLPARRSSLFTTIEDNQTQIDIDVTQGDHSDPAAVSRLDRKTVLVSARPAGAPIELVYGYDAEQVPHLEVNDLTNGQQLGRFEVRNATAMSDAQVAESADQMSRLKLR